MEWTVENTSPRPTAVIIQGLYDPSDAFGCATQALVKQVEKTHRVAMRYIEDASSFGRVVKDASRSLNSHPSLVLIISHGTADWLKFGEDKPWYHFWNRSVPIFKRENITAKDFDPLDKNARIVILSCLAGKGIAQKISEISQRTVLAPLGLVYNVLTCLSSWPCANAMILSYNEQNEQHMAIIDPHTKSISVPSIDLLSEKNKASFVDIAQFIKKRAELGRAEAQLALGSYYLTGLGNCNKSDIDAIDWISKAADQGHSRAQYILGCGYLIGQNGLPVSVEKAIFLFRQSAQQGFPAASFQLGIFHLNGQFGFKKSYENARHYFQVAAKNGLPQGYFALGQLCEQGRGCARSLSLAKKYYKLAVDQGVSEAKIALARLLFGEEQYLLNGFYYLNRFYSICDAFMNQTKEFLLCLDLL